jgi:DNA-directed RNA polymerase subunit F
MKYPLSYMIYSQAFQALPADVKQMALDRVRKILAGEIAAPKYADLTPAKRQAIAEILKETM